MQPTEIDEMRAVQADFVRSDREILQAAAQIVLDRPLEHQVAEGTEKGAVPIEPARPSPHFDAVGQQHLSPIPLHLHLQQPAGAGEQSERRPILYLGTFLQQFPNRLGHLERDPEAGAQPEEILVIQQIRRSGNHPLPLPCVDLQNLETFPRQLHAISRLELPNHRPRQIGDRLPRQFQGVILFALGKIAPDPPL